MTAPAEARLSALLDQPEYADCAAFWQLAAGMAEQRGRTLRALACLDRAMAEFLRLPVQLVLSAPLVASALELASATNHTVDDCLYLALAVDEGCPLVTADKRFFRAIAATPWARHARAVP